MLMCMTKLSASMICQNQNLIDRSESTQSSPEQINIWSTPNWTQTRNLLAGGEKKQQPLFSFQFWYNLVPHVNMIFLLELQVYYTIYINQNPPDNKLTQTSVNPQPIQLVSVQNFAWPWIINHVRSRAIQGTQKFVDRKFPR